MSGFTIEIPPERITPNHDRNTPFSPISEGRYPNLSIWLSQIIQIANASASGSLDNTTRLLDLYDCRPEIPGTVSRALETVLTILQTLKNENSTTFHVPAPQNLRSLAESALSLLPSPSPIPIGRARSTSTESTGSKK